MNAIRATERLNALELQNATPPSASWHADYRDTAWVYVGGLVSDLSEGDIATIFSQFGNPTHLNLIRDKENGKSKGFAFLKYEDQRSCDLAVDNLGGAEVLGRILRVDHTRYKRRDDEEEDTHLIERLEGSGEAGTNGNGKRASDMEDSGEDRRKRRRKEKPLLKEESELKELLAIKVDEDEDPMRDYLIREKKEEVERAKARETEKRHRHRHRHRDENGGEDREESRKHRHRRKESQEQGGREDKSRPHRRDRSRDGEQRHESYRRHHDDHDRQKYQQQHRSNDREDGEHKSRKYPDRDQQSQISKESDDHGRRQR